MTARETELQQGEPKTQKVTLTQAERADVPMQSFGSGVVGVGVGTTGGSWGWRLGLEKNIHEGDAGIWL